MQIRELPRKGEIWQHYKGDLYQIIGIGEQEADSLPVAVYSSIKTTKIYTRPLSEFMDVINNRYRFSKIDTGVVRSDR